MLTDFPVYSPCAINDEPLPSLDQPLAKVADMEPMCTTPFSTNLIFQFS